MTSIYLKLNVGKTYKNAMQALNIPHQDGIGINHIKPGKVLQPLWKKKSSILRVKHIFLLFIYLKNINGIHQPSKK
jgi:hypothetical protein